MLNNQLIASDNSDKQTLVSREEEEENLNITEEDMEIIRKLELLENLDMFQDEDLEFLKDYDTIGENINNEGNIDE